MDSAGAESVFSRSFCCDQDVVTYSARDCAPCLSRYSRGSRELHEHGVRGMGCR